MINGVSVTLEMVVLNIVVMEEILDTLEELEKTVHRQKSTVTSLNEKVEVLERDLTREKRRSTEKSEKLRYLGLGRT